MVHQYKLNGYNIVLDTCSGSIHSVDDLAYDVIGMIREYTQGDIIDAMLEKYDDVTAEDVQECIDDVVALRRAGKLFTPDNYEHLAYDFKARNTVIKALCLHVAHTCNLNCSYCFASQGKYQGERALMTFEVGKRAIDFLIENSGTRRNLEVDFFGGEPLMNWDVVKQVVAYAREQEKLHDKNFRFTLTTNGMLIDDEVIEFANKEMHNVVLSLDGRRDVHDHLRKDYAGNGSYDRIVPKFQEFVKKRGDKNYYMRGTFTHNNVDFTNDLFHMADLGFTELSMEPVVCAPDDPYALTEEDKPILFEQYELLAKEMLKRKKEGRPLTFYHYMLDLEHGPCIYKRISGCGSGTEYMAPLGASCIPAISLSGMKNTAWAISGRVLPIKRCRMNSSAATPMPERAVRIAGRSCIAPAAVRQMRTMQQAALRAFIQKKNRMCHYDAGKRSNGAIMPVRWKRKILWIHRFVIS